MAKVMEVMAILPRVNMAKSESNSGTGFRPWWRLVAIFS
jgi:hypothetical protein